MTTLRMFVLSHDGARHGCSNFALAAPAGTVVRFSEPTRSLEQNAKFHAICSDLARSRLHWMGKPRDAAEWKVLLVSGHTVATGEGAEVVRGIEGEMVNIRESTARMNKRRSASLIEYALAFCAEHGVELQDMEPTA